MKKISIFLIIINLCYLAFILGRSYEIKNEIKKDNYCIQKILDEGINLKQEYQEDISENNFFIHAYAMVVLKKQQCLWGYHE